MTASTSRPRNAPAGLVEAEVLRRGLETFAELGYDAASVRELAKRLAVSHNYINDRYGSKAEFWRAVVTAAMTDRRAAMVAMNEDDGLPDDRKLAALITDLYRNGAEIPEVNKVIADESARDTERLRFIYTEFIEPFFASLRPVLERLMAAGRMPAVPLELVFFAITGPVLALTHDPMAVHLGRPARQTPEQRLARADALASLVLNGLLPVNGPG